MKTRILYIRYVDGTGEKHSRFYDRQSRMWRYSRRDCTGYDTAKASDTQLTKMRKRHFDLPYSWNVFEWGWELCENGIPA